MRKYGIAVELYAWRPVRARRVEAVTSEANVVAFRIAEILAVDSMASVIQLDMLKIHVANIASPGLLEVEDVVVRITAEYD